MIDHVVEVHRDFPHQKINFIWLTLMTCMNEIIQCNGGNNYKIPHIGKEKLARRNQLPETIKVTDDALAYLDFD